MGGTLRARYARCGYGQSTALKGNYYREGGAEINSTDGSISQELP